MVELQAAVEQDGSSAIAQANLRDAMARSGVPSNPVAVATATDDNKPAVTASANSSSPVVAVDRAPFTVGADVSTPARAAPEPADWTRAAPGVPARTELVLASANLSASSRPLFALRDERSGAAIVPASSTPASPPATTSALGGSRLEVSNGNGVNGMATHVGLWLAARGMATDRLTNQQPFVQRQTVIQYRSGHEDAARRLAALLPANATTQALPAANLRSDVRVVLGRDWVQLAPCLASSACSPVAPLAAAPAAVTVAMAAQR
jgi:hypothetical protein